MSRTYGLIGSRPDLGASLAHAQLSALGSPADFTAMWGVGFFDKDEVLLRRGPGGQRSAPLIEQIQTLRTHGLLMHECDARRGAPSTEATPPLRYGHVLFSCQGVSEQVTPLVAEARPRLPDFLKRTVQGETMTELAFAFFLAELPSNSLARTRLREPRRSVDPLRSEAVAEGLRRALLKLDELCDRTQQERFSGDLWIHTGEVMMIAHRRGTLGLKVLRGRDDLVRASVISSARATGLDQSLFVTAFATSEELSVEWERLPENLLLTAERGAAPRCETL